MGKWKRQAEERRRVHHRAVARRLGKDTLKDAAEVATYSLQEALDVSGYSKGYLFSLLRKGRIAGAKKAQQWRIEQWSLHAWLAEHAAGYKLCG